MHKLSFHDAFYAGRLVRLLTISAIAVLVALESPGATAWAQTAERRTDPAIRPEFREPVTLASKEGVLEVRLTARQGQATLDTVAKPVQNFLLFDYEVIRGTASDGQNSGGNLYPAPTLKVFPGERLIVHFENGLAGLTIRDYFSPQYTPKGQPIPIYPEQMNLLTDQSPHPRSSYQSEGKCRQCVAAHPSRHVQHVHLRHSKEHAAGTVLVSQSSSWAHYGPRLWRSRRTAGGRTNGRQPAARHGEKHSHPQHGASVQLRL